MNNEKIANTHIERDAVISAFSFSVLSMHRAPHVKRVCRTWHRTYGVEVPVPGRSRAEGKEKGRCIVVRQCAEEAQSEDAGRRTGTGYEVWHTQDERARDREVLHLRRGVLYKSGVYALKVQCLTPGGLPVEQ